MPDLSQIQPGTAVEVLSIANSTLKPKLMELGIVRGKHLKVLFRAPLGDPIAIDVRGSILSLRLDEAALIAVQQI
jgi:ferrous iron transport protein A